MQALWMLLGAFFFASMAVCVKIASTWFNSMELVFWRGFISIVLLWLVARHQKVALTTRYPGMHAWRTLVGVSALAAWFFAIAGLPLATAMTLNYMSSLWMATFILGAGLIGWNSRSSTGALARQGPLTLAVVMGFAGVVLVLQPSMQGHQVYAGLVGLLSGLGSALAYMQVTALGRVGEPEARTVFYFAVGTTLVGALGTAFVGWSSWPGWPALWLVPVALLASLGQLCITRAYSHGATLVVACLQYSGIVFGALYSLLLFGEDIAPSGWLGMGLIVACGVAATALRSRTVPN